MDATTKKTGTVKEYAEYAGLNYATVRGYAAEGKLVMVDVDRSGITPMFGSPVHVDRLVDFAASDAALVEGDRAPKGKAKAITLRTPDGLQDVEYRKNFALARRRELELAQLEGKLVPVEDVKAAWLQVLAAVKAGVLRIPDRASQAVAASNDLREVRAILERECEGVLKGIHDELLSTGL